MQHWPGLGGRTPSLIGKRFKPAATPFEVYQPDTELASPAQPIVQVQKDQGACFEPPCLFPTRADFGIFGSGDPANSTHRSLKMPDWAENVITWDEVAQYIDEGTVESLGKLRRSEQQLTTYKAFMDQVGAYSLVLLAL